MAEIVNLANFEINAEKAQQELDKLTKRLHDLGVQQKANTKENNDLQKSISDLEKQTQSANGVTAEESKQLENLRNKQNEVLKSKNALSNEIAVARREQTALNNAVRTRITTDGEAVKMSQAIANALAEEVNTVNEARQSNAELIKLRNQLSPAIEEEREAIKKLNIQIDENTVFIKENTSAMEQQKMNIGNYKADIDAALSSFKGLSGGVGGFTDSIAKMSLLGDSASKQIKAMTTSVIGLTKSMLAFIFTPVGLVITGLVVAFTLIKNAMNQSAEATQKITAIFNALGSVVKSVLKLIEPLGTALIDGWVKNFKMVAEAAENAFKVAQKVVGWFSKDAAASMGAWADEVKESARASMELAVAEAKLEAQQSKTEKGLKNLQRESDKLKQTRDDETKSMKERMAANDAIDANMRKQMDLERALAAQAVITAETRLRGDKDNKESANELYIAKQALLDLDRKTDTQLFEAEKTRNSLQKEAAQKAKEARDKYYAGVLKKMNDELDLFIAQQGIKARTLEEDLALTRKISADKLAILKKELEAGNLTRKAYDAQTLQLQNELAAATAEVTVDNAKRELDEYIRLNNNKYLDKQRLDADLLQLETDRMNKELEQQKKFLQTQFENEVINKNDLTDALIALDGEYNEKKIALNNDYNATQKEDEKLQRDLDREAKLLQIQEDLLSEFDAAKITQDAIYQEELISLKTRKDSGLLNEANYNKAIENLNKQHQLTMDSIDKTQLNAKLSMYSDTFSGIGQLIGESTAAGKAAGVATATINTYQGISEVWKSPAILPEPLNTIMKVVQSGITLGSGLSAVKKISSTKTPTVASSAPIQGLATGGIVSGGLPIQRANGDNVLATLRTGEAVLNQSQRNFIGDDLLAASGMPLTGAASSTVGQGSPMVTEIANAVREASFEGTQLGSQSGAANGIIGLSENRAVQQSATF